MDVYNLCYAVVKIFPRINKAMQILRENLDLIYVRWNYNSLQYQKSLLINDSLVVDINR